MGCPEISPPKSETAISIPLFESIPTPFVSHSKYPILRGASAGRIKVSGEKVGVMVGVLVGSGVGVLVGSGVEVWIVVEVGAIVGLLVTATVGACFSGDVPHPEIIREIRIITNPIQDILFKRSMNLLLN
jgi:hypothetical protein